VTAAAAASTRRCPRLLAVMTTPCATRSAGGTRVLLATQTLVAYSSTETVWGERFIRTTTLSKNRNVRKTVWCCAAAIAKIWVVTSTTCTCGWTRRLSSLPRTIIKERGSSISTQRLKSRSRGTWKCSRARSGCCSEKKTDERTWRWCCEKRVQLTLVVQEQVEVEVEPAQMRMSSGAWSTEPT
jgi:hypothetical protein